MSQTCTASDPTSSPGIYQPRRPAATILHQVVRENLQTFLALAREASPDEVPLGSHVERAVREFLKCGILSHGFARVYCHRCHQEYLVGFSCRSRDFCPSCATRRMVETAAHLVDNVLPRVQTRQWVLSVPKRVRWFLRHHPAAANGILKVFLRAIQTRLRRCSGGAPADACFGAVAFLHRFGSFLNVNPHYHVLVPDGVFSGGPDGGATFHPALELTEADIQQVQHQVRQRGLRWLQGHGYLDSAARAEMLSWEHAGGWSVDGSVTVPGFDRQGLERLARYCARPPFSQQRLGRFDGETLVYQLRKPTVDGRTELVLTPLDLLERLAALIGPPRIHRHRYYGVLAPRANLRRAVIETAGPAGATLQLLSEAERKMGLASGDLTAENDGDSDPGGSGMGRIKSAARYTWAMLLARIYECLPLLCKRCGKPMQIIAFILDPPVIEKILRHIGEPTEPPPVSPARGPPQAEFEFDQDAASDRWLEMDQTAARRDDSWE